MLSVADVDTLANNLVYRVTARPTAGFLLLSGSALGVGGTFTQADIDSGHLSYYLPSGSYSTNANFANVQFQVRDGGYHAVLNRPGGIYSGADLETLTFNIGLTGDISAPTYNGQGGVGGPVDLSTAARDDFFYTDSNRALTISRTDVLANDSWYGAHTLAAGAGTNGSVSYDGTNFTFSPTADFVGTASFTYTLTSTETSGTAAARKVLLLFVVNYGGNG